MISERFSQKRKISEFFRKFCGIHILRLLKKLCMSQQTHFNAVREGVMYQMELVYLLLLKTQPP